MKKIVISTLLILYSISNSFSQSETDKKEIYSEVLKIFLTSKDTIKDFKFLILDSTTSAQFPSKIHDSIYQKYFKVDKKDFDAAYNFTVSYISYTKKFDAIPKEIITNERLIPYSTDSVYSYFKGVKKDKTTAEKCWNNFYHDLKSSGYCQFSKPYFIDNETAMIYFYEISGVSGSGWTYIFRKENNKWTKVYQKLQWGS